MSGPTLESVLAEHHSLGAACTCGERLPADRLDTLRWFDAHVAAAVLAWIEGRLADGDVREAVARGLFNWNTPTVPYFVIHGRVGTPGAPDPYEPIATAALAAVRGVLGEGVAR